MLMVLQYVDRSNPDFSKDRPEDDLSIMVIAETGKCECFDSPSSEVPQPGEIRVYISNLEKLDPFTEFEGVYLGSLHMEDEWSFLVSLDDEARRLLFVRLQESSPNVTIAQEMFQMNVNGGMISHAVH